MLRCCKFFESRFHRDSPPSSPSALALSRYRSIVSEPGKGENDAPGKHVSTSPPSCSMYSTFFDVHSTYTSIMSSPSLPNERALMCSLASELLVGQRNAIVARRVLPPNSPFSTTMTFAPASYAVIAATAPAPPQPNTTTSASSSQASLIIVAPGISLLGSLLKSAFIWTCHC